LFATSCFGQDLSTGLRLGYGGGLSILWHPKDELGLEGIIAPRWGGVILTAVLIRSNPMKGPEWSWYYGGGIHLGYHHRDNFTGEGFSGAPPYKNPGFDLIVGLRYDPPDWRINLSVDFKPSIELTTERNLVVETFGLSVRYLIRRE
jgi:hypothetical protein